MVKCQLRPRNLVIVEEKVYWRLATDMSSILCYLGSDGTSLSVVHKQVWDHDRPRFMI